MKIYIDDDLFIFENELNFRFVRSSGPGGQNVNKVSTAVQLRFDITSNTTLSDEIKKRLKRISGRRVTNDGELIIEAKRFRHQEKNRADAVARLMELIRKAMRPPVKRIPTERTLSSENSRIVSKKKRGDMKKTRKKPLIWDE